MKKIYIALFMVSIENLKNLKYHTSLKTRNEKTLKEEESIEICKILGLIENIIKKTQVNNLDIRYKWNKKSFLWRNKTKWIDG